MQDRFKFRCWHKPTKTMYEVFDFNENFIRATPDLVVPSIRTLNAMDCVLIQCTGLKDKKDKLIYEGNIVKDDHEALFYVKWCYNCFQLNPLFTDGYTLGILDDEFEVIGNIYKNPELLK